MKKVYQTIASNNMQAAIASLLELELNKVPKFDNNKHNNSESEIIKFMNKKGYSFNEVDFKTTDKPISLFDVANVDGGVNGFFYALVPSPTHKNQLHAVIVDSNLYVIHDPNPDGLTLDYEPEDIKILYTNSEKWYIDINGNLKVDEV